ncbi:MAG TPA: XRE family transcriptional regulator [Anaerolineae bacterium]|nr:XRE family transcriptional regulator [Anaerolineae bacterium]
MGQLRQQFAKRLKELRQQKGMTQEELATSSKLSISFIRALEQNVHSPSLTSIELLAKALSVEPKDLFDFHSNITEK